MFSLISIKLTKEPEPKVLKVKKECYHCGNLLTIDVTDEEKKLGHGRRFCIFCHDIMFFNVN